MSNDTDILISENLQAAIAKKDDAVTVSVLQKNNKLMEIELNGSVFPKREMLKASIDFNKMMIKRLQTQVNHANRL